jgi:hypothetical protein
MKIQRVINLRRLSMIRIIEAMSLVPSLDRENYFKCPSKFKLLNKSLDGLKNTKAMKRHWLNRENW